MVRHDAPHYRPVSARESASWGYSVLAVTIGVIVASVTVIVDVTWVQHATLLYLRATVVGSLQLLLVTVLATAAMEQWRKRIIRRTLELAFLNHHIRNAVVQVQLADHADRQRQHQLLRGAIESVSRTLYRVSTCEDVALSLDQDLMGKDLSTTEGNSAKRSHAE